MLKTMRESFRHLKWILFLVIFVFIVLVFADWGGAGRTGADVTGFAARVNGESISLQDYGRALYVTEKQYEQAYGTALTEEMRRAIGLKRQVLQGLVNQTLLLQEAEKLNLTATKDEVRRSILEMPALNPDGQFVGKDLYERYVTINLGYPSAAEFEDDLAQDLTLAKMDSVLSNLVVLPPQRVEEEYRNRTEATQIQYVLIPAAKVISEASVTQKEVELYYSQNRSRYSHAEQRRVKYLLADLSRIRSQINLTDEELRQHYEETREQYSAGESVRAQHILIRTSPSDGEQVAEEKRKKAEDLVRQLRAGADFATLARENSEDPGSAARGGDLGFFERGQMVPPFEEAAFSLEPGQISDAVQSQFGWHIIRVNEKRSEAYRPFDEVRPQIAQRLMEERARERAREQITTVRARIEDNAKKTEAEVRQLASGDVVFNDTSWFGKADVVTGLGRLPEVNDWTFKSELNDVGPIIETPRGPMVPYLAAIREAGITPLAEIRGRVEADARQEKARQIASEQLARARSGEKSLAEIASEVGGELKSVTIRENQPVEGLPGNTKNLTDAAAKAETGTIGGPLTVDAGAVLFEVTNQTKFDPTEFGKQKERLSRELRDLEARRIRASLIDKLRKSAKISLNESLVAEPTGEQPTS